MSEQNGNSAEEVAWVARALEAAQHDPDRAWFHTLNGRLDIDYLAAARLALDAAADFQVREFYGGCTHG